MKVKSPHSAGILKKLKRTISRDSSAKARLAAKLGYRTTNSIDKWFERESVPELQQKHVNQFLTSEVK